MNEPVILNAIRTPFGKNKGFYKDVRPDVLLSEVLKELMTQTNLPFEKIQDIIVGAVTQTTEQAANLARLATLKAGFPITTPATTVNRLCGSSQQAMHFAAQEVAAGDANYVVAGGVESMTRVPMFSDLGEKGFNSEVFQELKLIHQGESAELIAEKWNLSRQELDQYALESHKKAAKAPQNCITFTKEALSLKRDEGIRESLDPAKMASLPTVFRPKELGRITAGNASQLADGAAAVLVANREVAIADGFKPKAKFLSRVVIGDDPKLQLMGVVPATQLALKKAGLTLNNIDWIEINEAFASVVLAWMKEVNPDPTKVNPWGGAIAHGHPLGATGAALMAKMLLGLTETNKSIGLQLMCIGQGQAIATIIERL